MEVGPPRGPRRGAGRAGLAPGHRPVSHRRAGGRRPRAGGGGGHRAADHGVLCLAVEDRRPGPRRAPVSARGGGGVLPVGVPQRHAARRGRRRRPPRGQPRSRRARRQPRVAGRRVGALCRPGRAGVPDRRGAPRAAVAGALGHAAAGGGARRGAGRRRPRGPGPARPRPVDVGARAEHAGERPACCAAGPPGLAGHRAHIRGGRRRPRGHLPDRRADRRCHRAAVADAADRTAGDDGDGAAQRRRLGAARRRDRLGVRRGRPGRAAGRGRRCRLRCHGARCQPAGRRRPRGGMVAPEPVSAADPVARSGRKPYMPDRPYILLSCGMSIDGYLGSASPAAPGALQQTPTSTGSTPCAPPATRSWWGPTPCAATTRGCWCARRTAGRRGRRAGSRRRR